MHVTSRNKIVLPRFILKLVNRLDQRLCQTFDHSVVLNSTRTKLKVVQTKENGGSQ